ncbi:outer membrane beta-barrel protein [Portibacter marinus]|uniref:outer membrane beta-barrel protein n=1 Tax=Portibacter marinus TaxID=2898660 RepID=UPI001F1A61B5|nr:outer membrane beta-barrel protein [Portibacter marinus]
MKNLRSLLIKGILFFPLFMQMTTLQCQIDSSDQSMIAVSGYVDSYYAAYSNSERIGTLQPLITVGARNNTIGLNVAQLGLHFKKGVVRGNLTLHYGDIAKATWDEDFNNVQEANAGVRLAPNVWFDAGFFHTHIGTESFLPKNNRLSSTAFKTYNEPFYQAGARLTREADNWEFQLWVLNGYNTYVDINSGKSIGLLYNYNFSENTSLTYTNIYGRESRDNREPAQFRFYQNIYLNQTLTDKFFMDLGFDFATQTHSVLLESEKTAIMFAGVATFRYQFEPKSSLTARYEIFNDPDGFIGGFRAVNGGVSGYLLQGFTFGTEYRPTEESYLRAELRQTVAASDHEIFMRNDRNSNTRTEFLVTLGIALEKVWKLE